MSDWTNHTMDLSDSFDHDFGVTPDHHSGNGHQDLIPADHQNMNGHDYSNDFLDYQDPLKHSFKHQFQPFSIDVDHMHFVKPHQVEGYYRQDGNHVEGYYRDGDGNTGINRSFEQGGGYTQTNPDGNPSNNLK
jgi:hypothetical protein